MKDIYDQTIESTTMHNSSDPFEDFFKQLKDVGTIDSKVLDKNKQKLKLCKEQWKDDMTVEMTVLLLQQYPAIDFSGVGTIKQERISISMQDIMSLCESRHDTNFADITTVKHFLPDISVAELVDLNKTCPLLNYRDMATCKLYRRTLTPETIKKIYALSSGIMFEDLGQYYAYKRAGNISMTDDQFITDITYLCTLSPNPNILFLFFCEQHAQDTAITMTEADIKRIVNMPSTTFFLDVQIFIDSTHIPLLDVITILSVAPSIKLWGIRNLVDHGVTIDAIVTLLNYSPSINIDAVVTLITVKGYSISDIISIVAISPSLNLSSVISCLENVTLTPNDIKKILAVAPKFNFASLKYYYRNGETTIEDLVDILSLNPNVHVDALGMFRDVLSINGYDLSVETIKTIVTTEKDISFVQLMYMGFYAIDNSLSLSPQQCVEEVKRILTIFPSYSFDNQKNDFENKIGHNTDEKEYNESIWSSFIDYIEKNNPNLQIGVIPLDTIGYQNILSGVYLLAYEKDHNNPPSDRGLILQEYQSMFNNFLTHNDATLENKKNTDVIFAQVSGDKAFDIYRNELLAMYKENYGSCFDVFDNKEKNSSPQQVIQYITDRRKDPKNVGKKLIVDIGGHGSKQLEAPSLQQNKESAVLSLLNSMRNPGKIEYGTTDRSQQDINFLLELEDDRIILDIDSCFAAQRLDNKKDMVQNLFLSGSQQSSTALITRQYLNAYSLGDDGKQSGDRNNDGVVSWAEAKVYASI